jgi:hypothetical protein
VALWLVAGTPTAGWTQSADGPGADHAEHPRQEALQALAAGAWPEARRLLTHPQIAEADRQALLGLLALLEDHPGVARVHLLRALEAAPARRGIWLYVAQAELMGGDAEAAAEALARGSDLGRDLPSVWLLGVEIDRARGHWTEAWALLQALQARWPDTPEAPALQARWLAALDVAWTAADPGADAGFFPDRTRAEAWRTREPAPLEGSRGADRVQGWITRRQWTRALAAADAAALEGPPALCRQLVHAALQAPDRARVARWLRCTPADAWSEAVRRWLEASR